MLRRRPFLPVALALAALFPAAARADVDSLAVGIDVNCPYGMAA